MPTSAPASGGAQRGLLPRWLLLTPASQWSMRRRAFLGVPWLIMLPVFYHGATSGEHAHSAWFGVVVVAVYAFMVGSVVPTPRRYEVFLRRHRILESTYLGPLVFVGLGLITPLPLLWCAALAAVAIVLMLGLGRWLRVRRAPRRSARRR